VVSGREDATLGPEDAALLDRVAAWLVRRRLAVPAVLFLESMKPLSFVGSQALVFLEPVVRAATGAGTARVAALLENRENVEELLRRIESAEARSTPARRSGTGGGAVLDSPAGETDRERNE
jgi:hypothetical protein